MFSLYTVCLSVPLTYLCYTYRYTILKQMCVHYMHSKQLCCAKKKIKKMVIDITHSSHEIASLTMFPYIKHIQYKYTHDLFSVAKKQQLEENIYRALRDCKIKWDISRQDKTCNKVSIHIYEHIIRYFMDMYHIAHCDDFPDTIMITLDMPLIHLLNAHVPIEHTNGVVRVHRHEENIIKWNDIQ